MSTEAFDPHDLLDLIEESQDVQSDSMRAAREDLAETVELGHEVRSRGEIDRCN